MPPLPRDHPEQVVVGKILKPHGRGGEVQVLPLTDFPDRFQGLHEILLQLPSGERMTRRILWVHAHGRDILMAFEHCTQRSEALALKNSLLLIPRDRLAPLQEDTYYWFEIIGLRVYTEAGESLGVVEDILETGANDVYVVRDKNREVLIPAIAQVVRVIDVEGGRIVIHPMEGLLE